VNGPHAPPLKRMDHPWLACVAPAPPHISVLADMPTIYPPPVPAVTCHHGLTFVVFFISPHRHRLTFRTIFSLRSWFYAGRGLDVQLVSPDGWNRDWERLKTPPISATDGCDHYLFEPGSLFATQGPDAFYTTAPDVTWDYCTALNAWFVSGSGQRLLDVPFPRW